MQYEPYPIHTLMPHPGPHLDEAVESVLAKRFGGHLFIGIRDAAVKPGTAEGSELDNLRKGILLLGQGRGLFDDKDAGGKRIEGTCCALRMADYLEKGGCPELIKLYRAVNRVDGSATASGTDLSTLMKNAIDSFPDHLHPAIFVWAEQGVRAIVDYLFLAAASQKAGRTVPCIGFVRPTTVLERMIRDGSIGDPDIIARMRRSLASSEKQIENCIEVSYIMRAMKAVGMPNEAAIEWLYTGLLKMAQQQEQYQSAIREIREHGKAYPISPRWEGDEISLVLIRSSNPQAAKASRAKEFQHAVCIVRRPGGTVAVMPNGFNRLDMRAIWSLIRINEAPAESRKSAAFARYSVEGNIPEAPNWHMMANGAALNGSNHIMAVPTTLSDDALVEIVRVGFTDEAVRLFSQKRGGEGDLSQEEAGYLDSTKKQYGLMAEQAKKDAQFAAPVTGPVASSNETRRGLNRALDRAV